MRHWLATSMLLLGLGAAWPAQAVESDDTGLYVDPSSLQRKPGEAAERALIERAEAAEAEGDPPRALASYQELLRVSPQSSYERRASARLEWLKERSEGDYAPLSAFLKVRNKRDVTHDELIAFWREAEKFPPGRVKREAAEFTGEALMNRMSDPAAALPIFDTWRKEPGLDRAELEMAIADAALARSKSGDLSGAIDLLRTSGLTARPEWRFLRVQAFRRIAHPLALAVVGLFALLAIGALVRGARQLRWKEVLAPRSWLLAAYVVAFPCVLMVRFSNPLKHTSAQLATGIAVTLGVAIIAGLGARGSKLRWALAASAFCCCLAVGLLVAEQTEMLEGFMLWYGV